MSFDVTRIDEIQIENLSVSALSDYELINHSAGLLYSNPAITANGLQISCASVTACLYTNDNFAGQPVIVSVPASSFTCINNTNNYLYVDYNNGNPCYKITENVDLINESNTIPVNTILTTNGYCHLSHWDRIGDGLANKLHRRFVKTQRYARESGLTLTVSGANIKIGSGIVWRGARPFTLEQTSTDDIGSTWFLFSHNPNGSGWISQTVSTKNYTQYDNVLTGLQTLPSNLPYNINWIFRGVEDHKHGYIVVSPIGYKDEASALAVTKIPDLPSQIATHAILVGKVVSLRTNVDYSKVEMAFDGVFSGAFLNEHNELAGLDGGLSDPKQYYHLNNSDYTNLTSKYPTFDGIKFNLTPSSTPWQPYTLVVDEENNTIKMTTNNPDVNLQLGSEMMQEVYNNSGETILNGSLVYVTGVGGTAPKIKLKVELASSLDNSNSSRVLGMATCDIPNNDYGYVTTQGLVHDLDLQGLGGGTLLWLSSEPGKFTTVKPSPPEHAVYLGLVILAENNTGIAYIDPVNGFELGELHDVLINAPINDQVLTYDENDKVWKNKTMGSNNINNSIVFAIALG